VHFCFCYNFVKFPLSLINFGKQMAKWLKLYAMYTVTTKFDPCYYTTLLNVAVLNFYITLDLLQSDCSDLASKWRGHIVATTFLLRCHCQTCTGCLRTSFFVFQQDGAQAHREHNMVAFLERETRETRRRLSACVRTRGTFQAQILTILSPSVMTTNNC